MQTSQLFLSVLVCVIGYAAWLLARTAIMKKAVLDRYASRTWQDGTRNLIVLLVLIGQGVIWASEVRLFAFSIAAVAAAIAIVFKEVLLNFLGGASRSLMRPFAIGDLITVGAYQGYVTGVSWSTTVLIEVGEGYRATGKEIRLPNALLLTQAVINHAHTGRFRFVSIPVGIDLSRPIAHQEALLLEIAARISAPWIDEASSYFAELSRSQFVDYPSVAPRLILVPGKDNEGWRGLVQLALPSDRRVRVEQELIRELNWPEIGQVQLE